jgi:hypothetical protein
MNGKLKKVLSGIALLAAFGLGGAALAGARTGTTTTPAPTGSGARNLRSARARGGRAHNGDGPRQCRGPSSFRSGRHAAPVSGYSTPVAA